MKSPPLLILGLFVLATTFLCGTGLATDSPSPEEEPLNNGEDFTKPINRFDTRFQFETLPDATQSGRLLIDKPVRMSKP